MQYRLSELAGKKIYTKGGRYTGYVTGVKLSPSYRQVRGLSFANTEEEDGMVAFSAIAEVNECVVIKAKTPAKATTDVPFGYACRNTQGEVIGYIDDLISEDNTVVGISVNGKIHPVQGMERHGDHFILPQPLIEGETLKRDVMQNGEVLFASGTVITEEVTLAAQRTGRLVDLILNTL